MKKMLTIIVMSFGMLFADTYEECVLEGGMCAQLWVCEYDGDDTFTVCANSTDPINGAQFGIVVPGFTTTGVTVTDATAAWQSWSDADVLGFFFGVGNGVDPGTDIPLFNLSGTWDNSGSSGVATVVASNGSMALSDPSATNIEIFVVDNDWDGTVLDGEADKPSNYKLSNAYPNPFNPTTSIDYNVAIAGNVSIIIYDMLGREVKELVNEFTMPSGNAYTVMWDGENNSGSKVASGTYFYRMMSADFVDTHTFTLMK